MKRIAVVGMSENPGGVETYLMNFFNSMKDSYRIVFVNIYENSKIAYQDKILSGGGEVFQAEKQYSLKSYFNRSKIAKKILKKINADIVYVNALTTNSAYWVAASKILQLPVVYHSHNASAAFSSKLKEYISDILKPYNQRILTYATCLAASPESGKFMFGNTDSTIIYNSIEAKKWRFSTVNRKKIRQNLNLSDDKKVIIMVARLSEQKNIIRAIKIFKDIIKIDKSYNLVLVGDGDLKEKAIQEINNLELNNFVKMLGERNDIPELMAGSDILFLPSLFEGLPFVVIEAQGSGLPVIASRGVVPSISDITKSVFEISLKESNDFWANKIVKINLNDSVKRVKMNSEVDNSKFSMSFYDKKIKSIFSSL